MLVMVLMVFASVFVLGLADYQEMKENGQGQYFFRKK